MDFCRYTLDFFRADRFRTKYGTTDHYKMLPRPYSAVGYMVEGEWEYTEYFQTRQYGEKTKSGIVRSGELLYVPSGSTYDAYWNFFPCADLLSLHFEMDSETLFSERGTFVQKIDAAELIRASGDSAYDPESEFARLFTLFRKSEDDSVGLDERFEMMTRFYSILMALTPCLQKRDESEYDTGIEPAIRYIRTHFAEQLAVPALADMCYLSESHFYARFKQATGMAPIEYKNRVAISKAESILINEPSVPIEEVIERVGFTSGTYFRRVFQSVVGCTPREFRKNSIGKKRELL